MPVGVHIRQDDESWYRIQEIHDLRNKPIEKFIRYLYDNSNTKIRKFAQMQEKRTTLLLVETTTTTGRQQT